MKYDNDPLSKELLLHLLVNEHQIIDSVKRLLYNSFFYNFTRNSSTNNFGEMQREMIDYQSDCNNGEIKIKQIYQNKSLAVKNKIKQEIANMDILIMTIT